jgi:hypothetical protein
MAGVQVTIPGQAGVLESRQALMNQAIAEQFNIFSPPPVPNGTPDARVRQPSARDLGRPLTTTRLG